MSKIKYVLQCAGTMMVLLVINIPGAISAEYNCVTTLTNYPHFFSVPVSSVSPAAKGSISITTATPSFIVSHSSNQMLPAADLKRASDTLSLRLRLNSKIYTTNISEHFVTARLVGDTWDDATVSGLPAEKVWKNPTTSCNSGSVACRKFYYDETLPSVIRADKESRFSFDSSVDFHNPVRQALLELPVEPANEYREHIITITYTIPNNRIIVESEGFVSIPSGNYNPPNYFGNPPQVFTCTRPATPLVLTLQNTTLDFNNIQVSTATPVTRELNWTASGTGQASTWQMTFDTDTNKKDGNNILLGNAKVKVLDSTGTQVPLGTPINISGVTGSYTFELDPMSATPGTPSVDVNVTLTAN